MTTLRQMAQAIVDTHRDLALRPGASQRLALITPSDPVDGAQAVGEAARVAALAMGFDTTDANCLAAAWLAQTRRTGRFDATAWPQEPEDFGITPWPRTDAFAPCPHRLGLYAILPDAQWVGRMAHAGVSTVQLRCKSTDPRAIAREVRAAVDAVQGTGSLLFINDHWQAAIDAGAYGVHLGQEDLNTADLGAIRAAGLRLGLSSHGYAEMLRADRSSPSTIAIGAVFATKLKRLQTAPQGTARLARYTRLLRHYPTVAIGGISLERVPAVLASGVGSVAVVSALVTAPQPEDAVHAFQVQMAASTLT